MKFTVLKPIFAEAASRFVNEMSNFSETILLKKDHWVVDAKSLLGVLAVSLQPGQEIEIQVDNSTEEVKQSLLNSGLFEEA